MPTKYTGPEKLDMIRRYYVGASYREVRNHFAAEYPDRPLPSLSTIQKTVRQLETTYCLIGGHQRKNKPPTDSEDVCPATYAIAKGSRESSRLRIPRRVGTSTSLVIKPLGKNDFPSSKPPLSSTCISYHYCTNQNQQPNLEPVDNNDDNRSARVDYMKPNPEKL